jgi:hypothetical protein
MEAHRAVRVLRMCCLLPLLCADVAVYDAASGSRLAIYSGELGIQRPVSSPSGECGVVGAIQAILHCRAAAVPKRAVGAECARLLRYGYGAGPVACVSVAGNLTVRFISDGSAEYPGFAAVLAGSLCPGGTFSSTGRVVNGSCPGVCSVGYACPAGSTSGTAVACPGGTFGAQGLDQCPVHYMEDRCGRYGSCMCAALEYTDVFCEKEDMAQAHSPDRRDVNCTWALGLRRLCIFQQLR